MPAAFILLVLLGVIALWFILSFLYKPLGKLIWRIGKDAMDEINDNDEKEKEKEN